MKKPNEVIMKKIPVLAVTGSLSAIALLWLLCATIQSMNPNFFRINVTAPGVKIDAEMRKDGG